MSEPVTVCPAKKQGREGKPCPGLWCRLNNKCWQTEAM